MAGSRQCIPLRRSNREAAGLSGNETLRVRLELDTEKREVVTPPDLVRALKAKPPAWDRWRELSYSHQREDVNYVEQAKAAETRARSLANVARVMAARPPRTPRSGRPSR